MATRADLAATIAIDLKRTDLSARVTQAIIDAVDYYEEKRFYFLEGTATFTTTASQAWYASPSDLIAFDTALMRVSGNDFPMNQKGHAEIAEKDPGTIITGTPDEWAVFGESLRLYPTPNGAYVCTLFYHKSLGVVSGSTSNAWTNTGKELIRARAKWDVYHNYLEDDEGAARAAIAEKRAFDNLWSKNVKRMSAGRLRKYHW